MQKLITVTASISLVAAVALTGCTTSEQQLMPTKPGQTMSSIWHRATGAAGDRKPRAHPDRLRSARQQLRRPVGRTPDGGRINRLPPRAPAIETALATGRPTSRAPAGRAHFRRVPNPDITMYVYPHLTGGDGVPVPGYTTVFSLYRHAHYARAGEPSARPAPGHPSPAPTSTPSLATTEAP